MLDMSDMLAYTDCSQEDAMAVAARSKSPQGPFDSSTRLLGDVGELFSEPGKVLSAQAVVVELRKSVRRFSRQVSPVELAAFRSVVQELALQVERLAAGSPACDATADANRARQEDAAVQSALQAARQRGQRSMTTDDSIRDGNAALEAARGKAQIAVLDAIRSGELVSSGALQEALGVKRQALSGAVKAGRLFALTGPSGENFYPAFFADPGLDRRAIEKVAKTLGTLPAASKYFFFTGKSTLLQETPLKALRRGRLDDVVAAATAFVTR
jgi:hypothetical protein